MDIQYAVGERRDEVGRKKAHVTCEADEVDSMFVEDGDDLAVVGFALQSFGRDGARSDAAGSGAVETGGAFAVADDDGDFRVGNAASGDAIRHSLEIRTAAT